jgi:hypothetical protein
MATTDALPKPASHLTTPEEGRALFEEVARREMSMSGEEFIRRWDRGEFRGIDSGPEHARLMRLVMLMPFGRQDT